MPIQFPDFQRISFDEANPWLVGAERGQKLTQSGMMFPQELQAKILANQIAQVQAKYAEPNAAAALKTAQQHNIFDPRIWESEIGLRGSQSSELMSEAQKNKFLVNNPQYISPEGMLISQAIQNQQGNQGGGNPAPQAGGSSNMGNIGIPNSATSSVANSLQNINAKPGQLPQPNAPQFNSSQYNPNALAFNMPNLPSPTGNSALDNLYFKKFGMAPAMQAQLDLSKAQAEKYQAENIERNKDFNNQSVVANESTLNAHKFLDALDRTNALERGAVGGNLRALSDAAQETDTYANNMAISATKLFQGNNAVHAADIELNQMAKPSRKQNKDVAFDLAQGVIAKNDRMKERQQFYATGTQLGLRPEIMDAMWNKYETERPYINTETKMPNDAYKGTWRDYLHPESVNAYSNGIDFNQPNQKQLDQANFNKDDLKDLQSWAKKHHQDPHDFDKKNIYKLAHKEKLSLAQLKTEFVKMGVL
jgi:hypothetical protein